MKKLFKVLGEFFRAFYTALKSQDSDLDFHKRFSIQSRVLRIFLVSFDFISDLRRRTKSKRLYIKTSLDKFIDWLFESNLRILQQILSARGYILQIGIKRRRNFSDIEIGSSTDDDISADWGIVLQGALSGDSTSKYLRETLGIIRKIYPEISIVLSSYRDTYEQQLKLIGMEYSCEVVLSNDPGRVESPFSPNIVRQIVSTYSGLEYLYRQEKIKAIKIRFDQRITEPQFLSNVENIYALIRNLNGIIKKPILVTSMNSYVSIPGFASDMMHFGYIENMLKYWDPTGLENFSEITEVIFSETTKEIQELKSHPEVWLSLRYVREFNKGFLNSESFNKILWGNLVGVVNSDAIGQEWQKTMPIFTTNYHSAKWLTVSHPERYEELKFHSWLARYFMGE